ncbi:MAG: DUF5698 domain-containing protein [Bacilli bacterium]|nr:DUF5698 domain-containing protein [Bacilli bacterium]
MLLLLTCLKIFFARMTDVCLGTLRTVNIVKGRKFTATVIAFVEVTIWFLVAREAINSVFDSWFIPISFAGGYATGTYIGIFLSEKLIGGHLTLNIISSKINQDNINLIKDQGFGVSIISAQDDKSMLLIEIDKKHLKELQKLIKSIDSSAFIIANETTYVHNGFIK